LIECRAISQMHPSNLDLNMFVVFDAIYNEGGVTAAARRLNLTQPAISHALAKLRDAFDDPLFVRQGRTIAPTPVARRMMPIVRQSIQSLRSAFSDAQGFAPASARQRFTIGMRDLLETSLLPKLMKQLATEAPHVELAVIKANRRQLETELAAGTIDAAIDVLLPVSADVHRMRIANESLAVLARKRHPRINGRLTLKAYLAEQHIVVSARRRGQSMEDIELGRAGHRRDIRLRCQHYYAAARVVCATDLLCSMTEPVARILGELLPVQVLRLPLKMPKFGAFLYWHANSETDPASQWLRQQLLAAAR
jgi:DNA-binding transcriptional LysR family regulator